MRHRRGHDLRRTLISLARADGARVDILELCTHTPKGSSAIDLYTTFPWQSLCEEVAKLKVHRRSGRGDVVQLRTAAASGGASPAPEDQEVASLASYQFPTKRENQSDPMMLMSARAGTRTRTPFGTGT